MCCGLQPTMSSPEMKHSSGQIKSGAAVPKLIICISILFAMEVSDDGPTTESARTCELAADHLVQLRRTRAHLPDGLYLRAARPILRRRRYASLNVPEESSESLR